MIRQFPWFLAYFLPCALSVAQTYFNVSALGITAPRAVLHYVMPADRARPPEVNESLFCQPVVDEVEPRPPAGNTLHPDAGKEMRWR